MKKVFSRAELVDLRMRFYSVDDDVVDFYIEESSAPRFFVTDSSTSFFQR